MRALKSRLSTGRLPYNLYWFCYSAGERDRLPNWLREHESVRLVTPEDQGGTLEAELVFTSIARFIGVDTPALIQNPIGFFRSRVEELAGNEFERVLGGEGYLDALAEAERRWRIICPGRHGADAAETNSALVRAVDAENRGETSLAIELLDDIISTRGGGLEPQIVWCVARALSLKSLLVLKQDSLSETPGSRVGEALACLDNMTAVLEGYKDRHCRDLRVAGLGQRAMTLHRVGRTEEARLQFEAITRENPTESTVYGIEVAAAHLQLGILYGTRRQYDAAEEHFNVVIEGAGSAVPEVQRLALSAFFNLASTFVAKNDPAGAHAVFVRLQAILENVEVPERFHTRAGVARALVEGQLGRPEALKTIKACLAGARRQSKEAVAFVLNGIERLGDNYIRARLPSLAVDCYQCLLDEIDPGGELDSKRIDAYGRLSSAHVLGGKLWSRVTGRGEFDF